MFTGNSEVMVRRGTRVFTSKVKNVVQMENVSLLCMTGKAKLNLKYDFMPLESYDHKYHKEIEVYDVIVENTKGIRRTVTCTETQQVLTTVRSFCSILRLNQLDVIIDEEGLPNKVISVEPRIMSNVDVYSLELKYQNVPFINGITLLK
jgi:hypothetical protein